MNMDQQSEKISGPLKLIPAIKIGGISKFDSKLRDNRITKIILAPLRATIFFLKDSSLLKFGYCLIYIVLCNANEK